MHDRTFREGVAKMLADQKQHDGTTDPVFERTKTEAERGVERFRAAMVAMGRDPDEALRNISRLSETPRELTDIDRATLAVQGASDIYAPASAELPAHLRAIVNTL
jgi:hypothetical protein